MPSPKNGKCGSETLRLIRSRGETVHWFVLFGWLNVHLVNVIKVIFIILYRDERQLCVILFHKIMVVCSVFEENVL